MFEWISTRISWEVHALRETCDFVDYAVKHECLNRTARVHAMHAVDYIQALLLFILTKQNN